MSWWSDEVAERRAVREPAVLQSSATPDLFQVGAEPGLVPPPSRVFDEPLYGTQANLSEESA